MVKYKFYFDGGYQRGNFKVVSELQKEVFKRLNNIRSTRTYWSILPLKLCQNSCLCR